MFRTSVVRVTALSPHFVRVTVTDPDLAHFYTGGLDQRVKLLLPREDGTLPDLGLDQEPQPPMMEWYTTWRQLPDEQRNPIRTYTVRSIRPWAEEIDIDFAVHGTDGPASAWVSSAVPGDELLVVGPDGRCREDHGGIEFKPGAAKDLLLVGDETAAPAICAILEALPEDYHGEAYLEVPTAEDVLDVASRSSVRIHWMARNGATHGSQLAAAVEDWGRRRTKIFAARRAAWEPGREPVGALTGAPEELPEVADGAMLWETAVPEGFREYAWLAGEAGAITGLRRHLVKEVGLSRKQVSFMGYWKIGRAGS
ncbi:siderophore-interacting protein [Nesterenkonia flava]|uniref:Siderophore-interacting protein n=1 Tax=Nesterenkonia flava TaxID=469799 RepID=A0ABU1FUA7_9MICC|nr:siderophore-interacting protein [Nesterenkonia flava]MDR5711932.1 siderophore-interacting protein [Nesterenkonia flava]